MTRAQEFARKRQWILEYMERRHLDAVILTRRCNFAWLTAGGQNHVSTGADLGVASLLVTNKDTLCITNSIEAPRVMDEELGDLGISVRPFEWYNSSDAVRLWTASIGHRRTACDVRLPNFAEEIGLLGAEFDMLRWSLLPSEIDRYRALGKDVAECLEMACRTARPGVTEFDLASRIGAGLLERGIRGPVVLVAADDRVRDFRHPIPTMRRFENYGMGVTSAERGGLMISCTRLFSFGAIDEELDRRHQAVCQVDAEMMAATQPGRTLGAVFATAQNAYAAAGFPDEWRHHHQGGSTGYVGREVRATPGNATEVLANQAFAWNPSITGTKSEDTILIGGHVNEILSATGNWPTRPYVAGGSTWHRPDILML